MVRATPTPTSTSTPTAPATARMWRVAAAATALALAAPALAYVLPSSAIFRLAARKRVEANAATAELRGTLSTGATAPVAVALWVKGARCRLELVGAPDRPYAVVRDGKVAAQRGLDGVPGAAALAEGACALLGPASADAYVRSFASRGISVQDVALGRLDHRVAYVVGGRSPDPRPQAWIEKPTLHPLRLVAHVAGAKRDVRLLDYPPPPQPAPGEKVAPPPAPADLFPRAVEVHRDGALEARLAIEQVTPSPRIPDSLL